MPLIREENDAMANIAPHTHAQHRGTWRRAGRYPALVLQVQLLARCYCEQMEAGLVPFQGGYLNGPKASKCHCPDFRADWGGNLNAERDWDHAG